MHRSASCTARQKYCRSRQGEDHVSTTHKPAPTSDNGRSSDHTVGARRRRLRERRHHGSESSSAPGAGGDHWVGETGDAGAGDTPAPVETPRQPNPSTPTGRSRPLGEGAEIAKQRCCSPPTSVTAGRTSAREFALPMTAELAATVPSCAPFVDVVFEGNTGVWAHTSLGREMDITFTSVTVFPTEAEAAAMVAATATPEFDECWADFNEVGVVAWDSASNQPATNRWSHPTSNWAATHRHCMPSREPWCSEPPAFPTHASAPSSSRAEPLSLFTQRRPSSLLRSDVI